jgi:hypothetical protein
MSMTHPFRHAVALAWLATAPFAVLAQAAFSAASASPPVAAPPAFKSAFEGYRRFDDTKLVPWRESNDLVGRIGGWKAYARESAGADTAPASAPAASTPASGAAHKGHMHHHPGHHGGHPMPKKP